jgi:ABC-type branched-subunit amino acid transport system permease subunit
VALPAPGALRAALTCIAVTSAGVGYLYGFMSAEAEATIGGMLVFGALAAALAARFGVFARLADAGARAEPMRNGVAIVGVVALLLLFHDDDFNLLLIAKTMIIAIACLGLNVQFGYAGVPNFAGAAFFGIGGYTAALLMRRTTLPHLLALPAGGLMAAGIGSVLLLPLLRTRGHYAALITIAFGLLFRTFVEVNQMLGGPQGLKLPGLTILGWRFNDPIELGNFTGSFYLNYLVVILLLLIGAFVLVQRLERSWIGLSLDVVRLDETAAACFGIAVARWKIAAFTIGNFLAGVAGAISAPMIGFIAPNNFTFSESLIDVSIVLLGGIGNPWGLALAAAVVVLVPEKLQLIQEYRFLLYAVLVILILLFRPSGLLPRPLRRYFSGLGAS